MIFADAGRLADVYPAEPGPLRHALAGDERLTFSALAALARRLPKEQVEYYPGRSFAENGPQSGVSNGLSAEETVRRIVECQSWMVLKNVGTDPDYGALVDATLRELQPFVAPATGAMHMRTGFIFVSSPNAVVPAHIDPEHNVLMQIHGTKTFTVYADPTLLDDAHHEAYHADRASFQLTVTPAFQRAARDFSLAPGDAVHVPLKAPHAVRNGPEPSISFSVTWRSEASDREARLRRANRMIRRCGGRPPSPGARPGRDAATVILQKAAARMKIVG